MINKTIHHRHNNRRPRHPATRSGFTLLEVLATIMLVAIVLPVAMQTISLVTTIAGEIDRSQEAVILAETVITEFLLGEMEQDFTADGNFDTDRTHYHWRAEIEPWEVSGLRQLTVYVGWRVAGREREISVSTLVTD